MLKKKNHISELNLVFFLKHFFPKNNSNNIKIHLTLYRYYYYFTIIFNCNHSNTCDHMGTQYQYRKESIDYNIHTHLLFLEFVSITSIIIASTNI